VISTYIFHQLEALECLSLASSIESREQMTASSCEDCKIFQEFVRPSSDAALSWMSGITASHVMYTFKLMMASKYLSKFLSGYAPFMLCNLPSSGEIDSHSTISDAHIGELHHELKTALLVFEKKFILQPADLTDVVMPSLLNSLLFVSFVFKYHEWIYCCLLVK
jgi:hypothetical protein